ncbi:TPA: AAA family ATPase, partial [Acinetobacter baumannii]
YEKGFYFTSKYGEKKELKLSELSSGEQHQIVLFYELIFLAESGTYYLIDEPEISLHVDWQRSFLDDIARVEKLRGHKFLIATHSPQIIGSKRNLCIALDGGIL